MSFILSHIITNANILCSVSQSAINEMESMQTKAMQIIGITTAKNRQEYDICSIQALIDKHCINTLVKILNDQHHSITQGLQRKDHFGTTRNMFPFRLRKCTTQKYQNTYVPKYARIIENLSQTESLVTK